MDRLVVRLTHHKHTAAWAQGQALDPVAAVAEALELASR
jgi:hypothetical protein